LDIAVQVSPQASGTFANTATVSSLTDDTDPSNNTATATTAVSLQGLTALSPAKMWVGLANGKDVGIRFDLFAQVFKDGTLIGSGQLNSVSGGSSGFNNAVLDTIPLTLAAPVDFPPGTTLGYSLSVPQRVLGQRKELGHGAALVRRPADRYRLHPGRRQPLRTRRSAA
jgi:hypothetical protein